MGKIPLQRCDFELLKERWDEESPDADVMNAELIRLFDRLELERKILLQMGDEELRNYNNAEIESFNRFVKEMEERRGATLLADYYAHVKRKNG